MSDTKIMEFFSVRLELPRDLMDVLNMSEDQVPHWLRETLALELFRENLLSTGKAAELADLPKGEFIRLLKRHHIPYFSESPDDLSSQLLGLNKILGSQKK